MVERATLFQGVQIGLESVPGTLVPANKKLLATGFQIGITPEVNIYKPAGYKYPTIASLDTEWVEGSLDGQMSYTDITYLLASLISADTPEASGTTGQEWIFVSDSDGPDAPVTFTVEQGSSVRAHRFGHCLVTGLTLTFNTDGTELSGSFIGTALEDGVTMTASPTEIEPVPIMRPQIAVYLADTAAGLDGATALARALSVEWALTDRFAPVVTLNQSTDWDTYIESEPSGRVTLMLEADAEGMGLLSTMRDGDTKFIRVQATGEQIGAGPATYELTIDTAFKVSNVDPFDDEEGIFAIQWTGSFVHDATWGKSFQASVVNDLTAL